MHTQARRLLKQKLHFKVFFSMLSGWKGHLSEASMFRYTTLLKEWKFPILKASIFIFGCVIWVFCLFLDQVEGLVYLKIKIIHCQSFIEQYEGGCKIIFSTNVAQPCLTSVIGRELVYSRWYGRRHYIGETLLMQSNQSTILLPPSLAPCLESK